jgi:galacturan 1,4-alpha-galacturonidase
MELLDWLKYHRASMCPLPHYAMLRGFFLLSYLFWATAAVSQKRATCTVESSGDEAVDDVPNITAALDECGDGGLIVFNADTTYSIRSMVEFTACTGCEIQIEGTLKVSDDTEYWSGQRAILHIDGVAGATIHSTTGSGVIDGHGLPFWQGEDHL